MSDFFLFRSSLRDLLRPRKLMAALLLIAIPAGLAALQRLGNRKEFDPETIYNVLAASLVFGTVLVILAVVFGSGVITQELEQKTMVYLLTRPVPRWRILLVKFLAAVLVITLTVWLASIALALVTYGPGRVGDSRLRRDLLIIPVGAMAYGSLFLLLAALLNRPLMWGLLFAFGWESWVPSIPGKFQWVSIMTYLRVLAPHPQPERETIELAEMLAALNPTAIPAATSWWMLAGITVVALSLAIIIFSNCEYVPREDAE